MNPSSSVGSLMAAGEGGEIKPNETTPPTSKTQILTDISETAGTVLAELLRLARQCHLDHAGQVARRCEHPNGVLGEHLAPHRHVAEDDLQALEEVLAYDHNRRAAVRPAFARRDRLYIWRGHKRRWRGQKKIKNKINIINIKNNNQIDKWPRMCRRQELRNKNILATRGNGF